MNTKDTVKERLTLYIKHLGISNRKFEIKCNLANGYINNIRESISPTKLQQIALCCPDLNTGWLMTGNGNMLTTEGPPQPQHKPNFTYPDNDTRPRLPITVRGGFPDGFDDGVLLSECELQPVIHALPAYDYTMIVTGNSMEPNFCGGDEIAIRKVFDYIAWGEVYVLNTSDGTIIKRIYDAGDKYRCVSYNPEYAEFLVDKSSVYGVYKVVGLIRI